MQWCPTRRDETLSYWERRRWQSPLQSASRSSARTKVDRVDRNKSITHCIPTVPKRGELHGARKNTPRSLSRYVEGYLFRGKEDSWRTTKNGKGCPVARAESGV